MVFLGTPHRGSSVANIGDIAMKIGETVIPGYVMNRSILKCLKKNCDGLYQTANDFGRLYNNIQIFSFYESVGTIVSFRGTPLKHCSPCLQIVGRESAIMQLPNEVPQPLNTSHQGMCKFRDYEDPSYIKVMQSIRELMNHTTPQRLPGLFGHRERRKRSC
jgi:hypothetical protein